MEAEQKAPTAKTRKRLKLRRLASKPASVDDHLVKERKYPRILFRSLKRVLFTTLFLSITASVLLGHPLILNNVKQSVIVQEFLSSYQRHYYQIVHGEPHYCDIDLDVSSILARIRGHQILHQDKALQKLEIILRNQTHFRSIAIVGPSGVGKTMTARALEEHFPWKDNVRIYAWNTYVESEAQKFRMLRLYVDQLSECGRNLLIVDNLSPCDDEVVPILNQMIGTQDYAKRKNVIVIYVFQLNAMLDANVYQQQSNALQHMLDTTTINFNSFNEKYLHDCIRREALLENISMKQSDFDEIAATINATTSGCKKVQTKVLVYGRRLKKEIRYDELADKTAAENF